MREDVHECTCSYYMYYTVKDISLHINFIDESSWLTVIYMYIIPCELMDVLGWHEREPNTRTGVNYHRRPETEVRHSVPPLKQLHRHKLIKGNNSLLLKGNVVCMVD